MPKRPARKPNRPSSRRLMLGGPPAVALPRPHAIPTWWLNTLIGLFLLLPAWLVSKTFFGAFSRATLDHHLWQSEEFFFFALGGVLWALWFCGSIWSLGEPRPLRIYVFGHELTHAVWVWIMGGRVSNFEWSRDGGSILTDTHNVWIALAPYFYPIYSVAVILVYGVASFFYDVAGAREAFLWMTPLQWLFFVLGVTWSFHLTFTFWMIPKGQTDLTSHGTFFSLVFIYLMNVVILAAFLIIAAPEITCRAFATELLENTENLAAALAGLPAWLRSCADSF